MAFQIVDDILDFTGEQSAVGKPIGSDLLNGLVTLPAIYLAEANPDDEDVLSLPDGGWKDTDRSSAWWMASARARPSSRRWTRRGRPSAGPQCVGRRTSLP